MSSKSKISWHRCRQEDDSGVSGIGPAVYNCFEGRDGSLWVNNGVHGYESRVNYCPFCGFKASLQIVIKPGNIT